MCSLFAAEPLVPQRWMEQVMASEGAAMVR
jgi:hypothetical protein